MSVSLLFTLALLALIASPHCMGMCACALARPALSQSVSGFQAGRVLAYLVLGALAGGASSALAALTVQGVPMFKALQWVLHAVLAFVGVLLVFQAKPVLQGVAALQASGRLAERLAQGGRAPAGVGSASSTSEAPRLAGSRRFSNAFKAGVLWFFMPCAVLYAAVALAYLSASAWQGAVLMGVFAVLSSASMGLAVRFQTRVRKRFSEAQMYRLNGVFILLSLGLMTARAQGVIPTPVVLESLGFCL